MPLATCRYQQVICNSAILNVPEQNTKISVFVKNKDIKSPANNNNGRKEEIFHLNIFSTSCLNKWKMIPENSAAIFCSLRKYLAPWHLGEMKRRREKFG